MKKLLTIAILAAAAVAVPLVVGWLGLPPEVEERLAAMTPATYVGIAPALVDHLG